MHLPDGQQADGVAAADVDDVLPQRPAPAVLGYAEELDVRRLAAAAPRTRRRTCPMRSSRRRRRGQVADERPRHLSAAACSSSMRRSASRSGPRRSRRRPPQARVWQRGIVERSRRGATSTRSTSPPSGGRDLLGGKGVGPRGDDRSSACPCRPGSRSRPTPAARTWRRQGGAGGPRGRGRRARRGARGADGQALRRPRRPAARLRPLRRRRLDARDDGHDPQPRPQRRRRRGLRGPPGTAVRARLVPAAHPDVRRGRRRRRRPPLREGALRPEARPGRAAGHRSRPPTTSPSWSRRTRRSTATETGSDFPQDAREQLARARCAPCSSRGTARARRPTGALRDSGRPRHRRERRADGLRQQGRHVRHRRLLHARPGDGRGGPLRRVPRRTPRARTSSPGSGRPSRSSGCATACPRRTTSCSRRSRRSSATTATCRTSSSRSRRARSTSCRRASAKRTAAAALGCAVEMVDEGVISREEAVARIDPAQLDQLLHPTVDPTGGGRGRRARAERVAGRGQRRGRVRRRHGRGAGEAGDSVILVRWETTPDDFHGMLQAAGILTAHGGLTSHAAVVARGMGTPCVTGCEALDVDAKREGRAVAGHELREGDMLTIDGGTGEVIARRRPARRRRSSTRTSRRCSSGPTRSGG